MDSSIVKVHRAATGAKGRNKILADHAKVAQVNVHAVVDENGRPCCLIITGGQVQDSQVMIDLLEGAGKSNPPTVRRSRCSCHYPNEIK
ncbi:MAG: transposase [Magnetovibrio sp.]|nr:transposase [Magnetovibrio sp.]